DLGLDTDQSVISALATRVLRPGSLPDLDRLLTGLLDRWRDAERSLGVEVELRVFAHLAASDSGIRRQLQTLAGGQRGLPGWEIGQIVGPLWARGHRLRASSLHPYSPYAQFEPTERLLFQDLIAPHGIMVDTAEPDWRRLLDDALRAE